MRKTFRCSILWMGCSHGKTPSTGRAHAWLPVNLERKAVSRALSDSLSVGGRTMYCSGMTVQQVPSLKGSLHCQILCPHIHTQAIGISSPGILSTLSSVLQAQFSGDCMDMVVVRYHDKDTSMMCGLYTLSCTFADHGSGAKSCPVTKHQWSFLKPAVRHLISNKENDLKTICLFPNLPLLLPRTFGGQEWTCPLIVHLRLLLPSYLASAL